MFGKKNKIERFKVVIAFSCVGVFAGIILGFLFGLVIAEMVYLVGGSPTEIVPREMAVFLGMGFGSIIGSVSGVILGYKE
jgi:hypothetical protein